jgi:hypothetical protein
MKGLVSPGSFEFQLCNHPSIIIFSIEGLKAQRNESIGIFLAGLLRKDAMPLPHYIPREATGAAMVAFEFLVSVA